MCGYLLVLCICVTIVCAKGGLQCATVYIRIILVFLNTCTQFSKDEWCECSLYIFGGIDVCVCV